MAEIISLLNNRLHIEAEDAILDLGECADVLDAIPCDIITRILIDDVEDGEITAYEAIVRVTLKLLDVVHNVDKAYIAHKFISDCQISRKL